MSLQLVDWRNCDSFSQEPRRNREYMAMPVYPDSRPWGVRSGVSFLNCEKINPRQQEKVQQIVDYLKQNPNVRMIVIFGSSVTTRCRTDSDVDVYVEVEKDEYLGLRWHISFEVDLLTNFSVDARLMREIQRTGVVVYGCK